MHSAYFVLSSFYEMILCVRLFHYCVKIFNDFLYDITCTVQTLYHSHSR